MAGVAALAPLVGADVVLTTSVCTVICMAALDLREWVAVALWVPATVTAELL